jgi:RNA polymerase sigma-70 factor (family 1)
LLDFDHIFREQYERLFFFTRQFIDDEEECADIVSDAFEKVCELRLEIREDTVNSFLYTHVRNRAIDYLRRKKVERGYLKFIQAETSRYIDRGYYEEQHEVDEIVTEVLSSLGEPTRTIFVHCYVDRMKYREVAELLGISKATVKKHIVKALKFIREKRKKILKK